MGLQKHMTLKHTKLLKQPNKIMKSYFKTSRDFNVVSLYDCGGGIEQNFCFTRPTLVIFYFLHHVMLMARNTWTRVQKFCLGWAFARIESIAHKAVYIELLARLLMGKLRKITP